MPRGRRRRGCHLAGLDWLGFWTPTNTGEAQRRRANQQQPKPTNKGQTDAKAQTRPFIQPIISLPPNFNPLSPDRPTQNTRQRTQVSLTTITPSNLPSSLNTR